MAGGEQRMFLSLPLPLWVLAGLTVAHPEEAEPTSLWQGLGPTRAACWAGCDAWTRALHQLLAHGRHKDTSALKPSFPECLGTGEQEEWPQMHFSHTKEVRCGVERFLATTLPDNQSVLPVYSRSRHLQV